MNFITRKLSSAVTVTGIVNVHFFEFPSHYYTTPDKHPFYELVYVSSGTLIINSENYVGNLEKNQMIIHDSGESHALYCVKGQKPTVVIIGFACDGELGKLTDTPFLLGDTESKKLAEIIKEGRNVFAPPYDQPVYEMKLKKNPPFGAEQMLKITLENFLINLIRKSENDVEVESNHAQKVDVGEIIRYVEDNYLEKITIDELCFIFKTNRSTLCKEFKTATKSTITEYINDKKLRIAKKKISSTDKTFTEIAEELNFESIHYFTRFFKKLSGLSPKEYRKKEKSKK